MGRTFNRQIEHTLAPFTDGDPGVTVRLPLQADAGEELKAFS